MPKLVPIKRPFAKKTELLDAPQPIRNFILFLKNAEHDFTELAKLISNLKRLYKTQVQEQERWAAARLDLMQRYESLSEAVESDNQDDRRTARHFLNQIIAAREVAQQKDQLIQNSPVLSEVIDIQALHRYVPEAQDIN